MKSTFRSFVQRLSVLNHQAIPYSVVLLLALGLLSQCDEPAIQIKALDPVSGCQGSTITIKGTGFSSTPGANIVKLGETQLEVVSSSPNRILVLLPHDAVTGQTVTVRVGSNLATGPKLDIDTPTFFIRCKADGKELNFRACGPMFGDPPSTTCGYGIVLVPGIGLLKIAICGKDKMTFDFMDQFAGTKMPFNFGPPAARFEYVNDVTDERMNSYNVSNQEGSELQITNVDRVWDYGMLTEYDVQGTFQCRIAVAGGPDVEITEGEFCVRFVILN